MKPRAKESPLSLDVRSGRDVLPSELPEGTSQANTYILSPETHSRLLSSRNVRINLWCLQPLRGCKPDKFIVTFLEGMFYK